MFKNFLRGTNQAAYEADLILLASIIGIPIWILVRLIKRARRNK